YIAFGRKSEDGPSKDRKNALKGVLKKAPAQIPGEQYQYSNYGYSIAGEMIEVAGGKPYEVLLRERIWEPLGMEGAMIGAADEPGPDGFRGHRGSPPEVSPPGADNPRIMSPAGTFSYPLAAYSRFMLDQLLGQQGDEAAMLTAESYKLIATAPDDLADYGLGWGLLEDGALRHSGSNTMWYVTTIVAPNDDIAVALFTNYGDSSGMGAMLETLIESAAGTREECAEQGNAPEDCSG
ncbi:MAG: beta-lactamase family protein, partial [Parvularculaceae bacterium]|nr:beta-lactamase family protein [Parvularculaceae bacterium]